MVILSPFLTLITAAQSLWSLSPQDPVLIPLGGWRNTPQSQKHNLQPYPSHLQVALEITHALRAAFHKYKGLKLNSQGRSSQGGQGINEHIQQTKDFARASVSVSRSPNKAVMQLGRDIAMARMELYLKQRLPHMVLPADGNAKQICQDFRKAWEDELHAYRRNPYSAQYDFIRKDDSIKIMTQGYFGETLQTTPQTLEWLGIELYTHALSCLDIIFQRFAANRFLNAARARMLEIHGPVVDRANINSVTHRSTLRDLKYASSLLVRGYWARDPSSTDRALPIRFSLQGPGVTRYHVVTALMLLAEESWKEYLKMKVENRPLPMSAQDLSDFMDTLRAEFETDCERDDFGLVKQSWSESADEVDTEFVKKYYLQAMSNTEAILLRIEASEFVRLPLVKLVTV